MGTSHGDIPQCSDTIVVWRNAGGMVSWPDGGRHSYTEIVWYRPNADSDGGFQISSDAAGPDVMPTKNPESARQPGRRRRIILPRHSIEDC